MKEKFIDIDRVLLKENPKLLKWAPGFLISYLKKIAHQDDLNDLIDRNQDYYDKDFCQRVINEFEIEVTAKGLEHIPKTGHCIVAANHPLGGMDALAIVTKIHEIRPDMMFIVNSLLMNLDNLKNLFTGVSKIKANTKSSLKKVNELFASDRAICIFPAGLVSRKKKGVIEDLEWKKTFISQAKKHNTPVVPLNIEGDLSSFFYRLANLREALGIKTNIEMLYLADELFKQHKKKIDLILGAPIQAATFQNKEKTDLEWAQWVKNKVYALRK